MLLAWLAAVTAVATSNVAVFSSDLMEAIQKVQADYEGLQSDPFYKPSVSTLSGDVSATLPFVGLGAKSLDPNGSYLIRYSYGDGKLRLYLFVLPINGTQSLPIYVKRADLGKVEAVNGYGAKFSVSRSSQITTSLLFNGVTNAKYEFEIDAEPDKARQIAENAALRIEGILSPTTDGKPYVCKPTAVAATLSSPSQISGNDCAIGINVTRLAIIDRRDGQTMKRWI